jgi:hypothetical protein
MRIVRTSAALALAGVLVAAPARAQREPAPSGPELRALRSRMKSLADSMREYGPSESFARYFPREGAWVWRQTLHGAPNGDRVATWSFPAAQTIDALSSTGPLCPSFFRGGGEVGTGETTIAGRLSAPGRWRWMGLRFVPPGAPATSPTFVEWRREGGEWVISALGDEESWIEPAPETLRTQLRRSPTAGPPLSLPLPQTELVAAAEPWFRSDGMIWIDGLRRVKYGLPRRLDSGDVTRIGWIDGVPVYAEPAAAATAEVVYIPVDREGSFQPYYRSDNYDCR